MVWLQTNHNQFQFGEGIVKEEKLSTIMITHNMKAALEHGDRTIMMHDGRIIMDLNSKDKQGVTVEWLIDQFSRKIGAQFDNDRMLLS
jgi:putative ABC transport system ATP-binding protein